LRYGIAVVLTTGVHRLCKQQYECAHDEVFSRKLLPYANRHHTGQWRSHVSATPWRRCGSQIAHEGFQTTSAPGQEGYAGPSARAAITATVLLELPAASYRLVPNILHHSASQRTYNSRICIAWPSLNTAGESTSHYCSCL